MKSSGPALFHDAIQKLNPETFWSAPMDENTAFFGGPDVSNRLQSWLLQFKAILHFHFLFTRCPFSPFVYCNLLSLCMGHDL